MDLTGSSLWRDPQIVYHIELLKLKAHQLRASDYYPQAEEPLEDQYQHTCNQSQEAQKIYGGVQNPLEQEEDQI